METKLELCRNDCFIKASNLANELEKQRTKTTKASAKRARKMSLDLAKAMKEYRRLSVQEIG